MERVRVRTLALAITAGALLLGTAATASASASSGALGDLALNRDLPNRIALPALLPNSKENTSAIAQNNGTSPATIAMDIYTPAGVLIPSASKVETNVPPGGTRTFAQAINTGLTPGFRGVGVLSSDQPINALLVRDIEENGTYRKSYSVHNAYPTGSQTVTLPYISNNVNGLYNTRFAIANTGTSPACVTIAYAYEGGGGTTDNGPGGSGCATGYAVPVGGQVAFGPQAVPSEATLAMPAATNNRVMAATVTATGSPVTVAVDAYLTGGLKKLASYDGFNVGDAASTTDDLGTEINVPLALKLDGYYSQILLSNTNAAAVNATITYNADLVNCPVAPGPYTVNVNVPANGTASHSVYQDSVVPEGFCGSATVTAPEGQPIAAVLFRSKMTSPGSFVDEDLYTAVNGVPVDRATTTAKFPLIFRRAYSGGGLDGYNTWVSVAVADGTTANVTLTTVADPTTGAPGCGGGTYTATRTINGSFIFYQNLNDPAVNGLNASPGCLWGGMVITSDKPIIAIANVTNDIISGDNDGNYNGFGS